MHWDEEGKNQQPWRSAVYSQGSAANISHFPMWQSPFESNKGKEGFIVIHSVREVMVAELEAAGHSVSAKQRDGC